MQKISDFSQRLRSEIEYSGFTHKEFAAKADIEKRALGAYLGTQKSMPPADKAVKMARVLGVSVEYLVTGREFRQRADITKYLQFRDILDDMITLPSEVLNSVKILVKSLAKIERKR